MTTASNIRWGRVIAGGLLAEVALIVAIVPLGIRLGPTTGDAFLHYTAGPGSFLFCFLGALWVGRKLESRFVLHGVLVGIVAALFYIALTKLQPEPLAYIVAHVLKLAGGAAGGYVAQRRRTQPASQPAGN
jgi:putative membrane protein (TIGR04086 family)